MHCNISFDFSANISKQFKTNTIHDTWILNIQITEEKPGHRKDLIGKLSRSWMDEAEKIKMFLDVQNLQTEDTSAKEEENEKKYLYTGNVFIIFCLLHSNYRSE